MQDYKKPLPVPSSESKPYWDALRERRLMIPRCDECKEFWFPPSFLCPHCSSAKWTWAQASGKGRIFSYVVYHRVYHPGFADEVPYAVAVIELAEGPRMISNVVGIAPEKLVCDMPVEITYVDITEDRTIPKFRPAPGVDAR
jgi:uncharacterized OB-fold protein